MAVAEKYPRGGMIGLQRNIGHAEPLVKAVPGPTTNHKRRRRSKKGSQTSWVYLNALEDFSDLRTRDRLMKGEFRSMATSRS